MNKLALALIIVTTAIALQVPLVFAALPVGCTGNPHHDEEGSSEHLIITGNPHDPSKGTTSSGFETGNPHDSCP